MISKKLAMHMIHWTGIQNGVETDANGNLPTYPERIIAGSCIVTVFACLNNDHAIDEDAYIAAAYESLGSKWNMERLHTDAESLAFLKEVFAHAG